MKDLATTHIGEDYGKVEVRHFMKDVVEYEVPLGLAKAIQMHQCQTLPAAGSPTVVTFMDLEARWLSEEVPSDYRYTREQVQGMFDELRDALGHDFRGFHA